ncbi:hypothetical protein [Winogradskyella sp. SM1960]|uniref:hypothetical protein n=1 Tax=Winogradskyella sp. SM1960 TaxID=2865955 RepID=UPI001CD2FE44|nr:hypothetical protein [Winogradskyella sp. SM1960]
MIQAKHCDLCEYPQRDLKNGLTCGITNKKPDFKEVCPDILLDKKFQQKLENINFELDKIKKTKNKEYLTFYILIIIGFLLIIGNKYYANISQTELYSWRFRASAIGVGITILISAYFKLNRFRTKLKAVKFKKNKIDSVLRKYKISYKMNFDYREKIHGNQNIEIITEYKNWKTKRTTTPCIINC